MSSLPIDSAALGASPELVVIKQSVLFNFICDFLFGY